MSSPSLSIFFNNNCKVILLLSVIINLADIILIDGTAHSHDPKKNTIANKIFSKLNEPTKANPSAIGSYAKGCVDGAKRLPFKGPNWQVLHPQRNRNWGHPETIELVKRVSKAANDLGWTGLFIGDISQARGGPMPYGHKSHQMGLDVDIWLTQPKKMGLTKDELKEVKPISVRSRDRRRTNHNWTDTHMAILKFVALDKAVDRVFITAPAKISMCERATGNRNWLQKVRPLGGHHQHFHIRLHCPPTSLDCIPQSPTIKNISQSSDGCDHTLKWWVTKALEPYKKPSKAIKKSKPTKNALTYTMRDLPKQCTSVIHSK